MKAVVLREFGTTLSVEDMAGLVIGTGEVLVDVAAAPVLGTVQKLKGIAASATS